MAEEDVTCGSYFSLSGAAGRYERLLNSMGPMSSADVPSQNVGLLLYFVDFDFVEDATVRPLFEGLIGGHCVTGGCQLGHILPVKTVVCAWLLLLARKAARTSAECYKFTISLRLKATSEAELACVISVLGF